MTHLEKLETEFRAAYMTTPELHLEGIKLAQGTKRDQATSHLYEVEWRRRKGY